MKPTKDQVLQFIKAIKLEDYAEIGEMDRFNDEVSVDLVDFCDDPGDIHNKIAEMFKLKAVDSQDEYGNIMHMVNMPGLGSFGIARVRSKMFDGFNFSLVICNQKYFKAFKSLQY